MTIIFRAQSRDVNLTGQGLVVPIIGILCLLGSYVPNQTSGTVIPQKLTNPFVVILGRNAVRSIDCMGLQWNKAMERVCLKVALSAAVLSRYYAVQKTKRPIIKIILAFNRLLDGPNRGGAFMGAPIT